MDKNIEILNLKNSSPMILSIFLVDSMEKYWHESIEIIYVLSGTLEIQCGNATTYNLKEDDIILINMFDIHTLKGIKCEILSLQINIACLDSDLSHFYKNTFNCNSAIEEDKTKFIPIKRLIASILKTNMSKDENINILNKSYIYNLFYILNVHFKIENSNYTQISTKNSERIKNILNYINENYNKKICLNELSAEFYLSVPYISKIFKDFTKLSFSEYLTEVRLSHAINDLAEENNTIEYISTKNGFPNARSFVASFKNKYNCNPSKYRKGLNNSSSTNENNLMEAVNYLNLHHYNSFNKLVSYLKNDEPTSEINNYPVKIFELSPIDVKDKSLNLNHTYKNLICVGKAKHILNAKIQNMLQEIQNDIGFKYIRFHGLLDDEMMLYSEDENGNMELSFNHIDSVIDYLLSINLKPFVELSFMPKELASTPNRAMFFINSIISLPKDINKWNSLIKKLVNHFIMRYGIEEVKEWPFFLWNEPDLIHMFGFENKTDFFNFYKETYMTIKHTCNSILFGSSPVFSDTLAGSNEWMDLFIKYCKDNNCIPDYLTMHFYPMDLSGKNPITLSKSSHSDLRKYLIYRKSENALKEDIATISKKISTYDLKCNDLYLIGWNSSISHNELLNDTAYKSVYIAKNLLENYDSLKSFGYWQISDFTDEVKVKPQLYHGGQGLFTYNGIKKSHYYVFKMLNKLGDNLLTKGNGFFVTTNGHAIQIILYNYEHFSSLYGSGELFDMTFRNRYTPFLKSHILKMVIPIVSLEEEKYIIKETIVNRKYGSSFDKWIELGAVSLETNEDIEYLKQASIPKVQKKILNTVNNQLTITCELEPHEVRLIELTPWNEDL